MKAILMVTLLLLILTSRTKAAEIEDFSIIDLPYKYEKLMVVAHMSNGTDCPVTLTKEEFYGKYTKETKELFALLKEVCEERNSN